MSVRLALLSSDDVEVGAVAYIKYERASTAALAVETLHESVLNSGRGPTLKVMLAEAPNARQGQVI